MTEKTIGFAHRGAPRNRGEQNTMPAFQRALAMGAGGLESDIGLTADGIPVLLHTGIPLGRGLPVARLPYQQLPPTIPSLAALYEQCGTNFELSLDMAEPRAAEAVVAIARRYQADDRLWLTYWHLSTLERWREQWPEIRMVYPTIPLSPGRLNRVIDRLVNLQVNALNLYHLACSARAVERAHAHDVLVFAWGIRHEPALRRMVQRGVDGVFCDDVDSMVRLIPKTS